MIPMVPLDGGWITLAVSPYLWIAGLAVLVIMFFMGILRNPLIFVLVILSLPRLWQSLKTGSPVYGLQPATTNQKWIMGLCYVSLGGFLFWCMMMTKLESYMEQRAPDRQVTQLEKGRTEPLPPCPLPSASYQKIVDFQLTSHRGRGSLKPNLT
jgi:hypothetical protein